ncbi:MAG TPA: THUMP domain-containing protein [Candidatus Nanopelagicales bacterium]|nr:THUMP domain-containing protein [Candidatus Nanopelagicales bacterium]
MDFFATAAKGTEPAIRDELRELRFRGIRADRGGVHFHGPLDDGFRACLELRCAQRVLGELARFQAPTGDALYEGVTRIDWTPFLDPSRTLAVRAACKSSALTHTQFIAQKTKDAIVDQLRRKHGARPSVDRDDPDVGIFVHLARDQATVYIDLSGDSLHRRGWRGQAVEAPLKETLAAAILRLSAWDRARPLLDPMCGSGTFAIEGALWAQDIAPGLLGEREGEPRVFGFERWGCHDETAARRIDELRDRARARIKRQAPLILASDADPRAVEIARANVKAAGVRVDVRQARVQDLKPTQPPGHVVINPPYGERLPGSQELYRDMARALRRLAGHRVAVLAGAPEIERAMEQRLPEPRARLDRSLAVWNGAIECRLLTYDVP